MTIKPKAHPVHDAVRDIIKHVEKAISDQGAGTSIRLYPKGDEGGELVNELLTSILDDPKFSGTPRDRQKDFGVSLYDKNGSWRGTWGVNGMRVFPSHGLLTVNFAKPDLAENLAQRLKAYHENPDNRAQLEEKFPRESKCLGAGLLVGSPMHKVSISPKGISKPGEDPTSSPERT